MEISPVSETSRLCAWEKVEEGQTAFSHHLQTVPIPLADCGKRTFTFTEEQVLVHCQKTKESSNSCMLLSLFNTFETPRTVALQAPLSWISQARILESGCHFLSPRDLHVLWIELRWCQLNRQVDSLPLSLYRSPNHTSGPTEDSLCRILWKRQSAGWEESTCTKTALNFTVAHIAGAQ